MNNRAPARAVAIRRRVAGWSWLAAWAFTLHRLHLPWTQLGGLVSERVRWSERFVLATALLLGWTVGSLGRAASERGGGPSHATLLRRLLWPLGVATAATLVALLTMKLHDPIGIVFIGLLAYWAGFDLAFGALPLMSGRVYSLREPLWLVADRELPPAPDWRRSWDGE